MLVRLMLLLRRLTDSLIGVRVLDGHHLYLDFVGHQVTVRLSLLIVYRLPELHISRILALGRLFLFVFYVHGQFDVGQDLVATRSAGGLRWREVVTGNGLIECLRQLKFQSIGISVLLDLVLLLAYLAQDLLLEPLNQWRHRAQFFDLLQELLHRLRLSQVQVAADLAPRLEWLHWVHIGQELSEIHTGARNARHFVDFANGGNFLRVHRAIALRNGDRLARVCRQHHA